MASIVWMLRAGEMEGVDRPTADSAVFVYW
jgi:hypothetical protein